MEINMKHIVKLLGILAASMVLFACDGGGGGSPAKKLKIYMLDTESVDNNQDGVFDKVTTYSYDDKGTRLTAGVDNDGDGLDDYVYSYRYDKGDRVEAFMDFDGDGETDKSAVYTFDINGYETSRKFFARGVAKHITEYTNYGNGNRWSSEGRYLPDDGVVDVVEIWTYDESGNNLTYIARDAADKVLVAFYKEYDDKGNLVLTVKDDNKNGVFDEAEIAAASSFEYTFDKNGNKKTQVEKVNDEVVSEITYTWKPFEVWKKPTILKNLG